jgi:hypothetical protein
MEVNRVEMAQNIILVHLSISPSPEALLLGSSRDLNSAINCGHRRVKDKTFSICWCPARRKVDQHGIMSERAQRRFQSI